MDVFSLCLASVLCGVLALLAWFVDPAGWSARKETPWKTLAFAHGLTWRSSREPLGPSLRGTLQEMEFACELAPRSKSNPETPSLRLVFAGPHDDSIRASWSSSDTQREAQEHTDSESLTERLHVCMNEVGHAARASSVRVRAGAVYVTWDEVSPTPEYVDACLEPLIRCARAARSLEDER